MIMRAGLPLLLPVKPWFIWLTLTATLLANMLLDTGLIGRAGWTPDLLAIGLVFWGVHQPLRVGVGAAFAFGLAMDVHQGALLGQHALAYTVLAYLAVRIHRRLTWFGLFSQALHVLPLFAVLHGLQWLTRALTMQQWPDWSMLLAPVLEAALWPAADWLLLAPQRRAHDPDEHRPL